MKTYPQDLITLKEARKYGQKVCHCIVIWHRLWPSTFEIRNLEDQNDLDEFTKVSQGEFPDDFNEQWNDRSQWEVDAVDMPEGIQRIALLIKPTIKILIVMIHKALQLQDNRESNNG